MQRILRCHDIADIDFVRGENCHLYDSQDRRYVDFESGIWATVLGHNHPRIREVMHGQIDRIMHLGTAFPSEVCERAASSVLEAVGLDDGKCTFLSSGSEAVQFAADAARHLAGKSRLVTFADSYLSAYRSTKLKRPEDWLTVDWRSADAEEPTAVAEALPLDEIGAFVFEPGGSGSALVHFPPTGIVSALAEAVSRHGGLIIANEVTTGMGRTGEWFGFRHYDVRPDIVALGKGVGNGYPVSVVAMTASVAEAIESSGLRYAQSHQNDPLGCAVANEVFAVMREEKLVERSRRVGERFLDGLRELKQRHDLVKDVRGRGMLLGLELRDDDGPSATEIRDTLLGERLLVGCYPPGNLLRFDPALTIDEEDIERLLESMDSLFGSTSGIPRSA